MRGKAQTARDLQELFYLYGRHDERCYTQRWGRLKYWLGLLNRDDACTCGFSDALRENSHPVPPLAL